MPVSRLIWIVLLTGGIASAHQEGPLAGRGNWGLGVALPSESGSSFSVWKIRSPTTALGLEVDISWSYADSTADAEEFFGDRILEWSLETFQTKMTALVYF